jgi:tRNA (guanine37-N1)-methyltransferase
MTFHVLTIFPHFVRTIFEWGVLRRAAEADIIRHDVRDLRDYTEDRHRTTDDVPFGGGPGMVMRAEPIFRAVEAIRGETGAPLPLIYLTPGGELLTHPLAVELAQGGDCILLCGRYEGVDQRVIDHLVDREISIGNYVLSGGELAAMVVIDAVARQIPGVVGKPESLEAESFVTGLLDWPHYTRPEVFRDWQVPEVLLSGNHARILAYRQEAALLLTYRRRRELLSDEQRLQAEQILARGRQEGNDASADR